MTAITPKFISVPDAITGEDVPALITSENEDGTANVVVFGSSDVIEKRVNVDTSSTTDVGADDEPATATGKRRATTESGDSA